MSKLTLGIYPFLILSLCLVWKEKEGKEEKSNPFYCLDRMIEKEMN